MKNNYDHNGILQTKEIRALYNEKTIRVYQAYNEVILLNRNFIKLFLVYLLIIVNITGCKKERVLNQGNQIIRNVTTLNQSGKKIKSLSKTTKIIKENEVYSIEKDEKLLFQSQEYCYIQKSVLQKKENDLNDQNDNKSEAQTFIYKIKVNGEKRMILFKAPELNWEFDFAASSNDWVYFTVDVTIPGSESYPEGIVRINKKTDKLDFVASPFAYGLKENRGKAYFFWHSSEDNDEGGIYQLDLDTSHIKKIGPLPNLSTHPAYNWGEITKIEDENIYFFWVGDTEEDEGTYNLDIKSGVIQKVTNENDAKTR